MTMEDGRMSGDTLAHREAERLQEAAGWAYQYAGVLLAADRPPDARLLDVLSSLSHGVAPTVKWPAALVDGDTLARRATSAEIERLRGRVAALREHLREFANYWHRTNHVGSFETCSFGDCPGARALLAEPHTTEAPPDERCAYEWEPREALGYVLHAMPESVMRSVYGPWPEAAEAVADKFIVALREIGIELVRAARHDEEQRPPEPPVRSLDGLPVTERDVEHVRAVRASVGEQRPLPEAAQRLLSDWNGRIARLSFRAPADGDDPLAEEAAKATARCEGDLEHALPAIVAEARREGAEQALDRLPEHVQLLARDGVWACSCGDWTGVEARAWSWHLRAALLSEPVPER